LVSDYTVELLSLRKEDNGFEHSYFKNKCKIFYLDKETTKINLLDICTKLPLVFILYFNLLRFLFNVSFLKNLLALFIKHRQRYDYVYATYNVSTVIYGTYFKKISSKTKLGFGIFDYYGGIFNLNIPQKHINYKVWLKTQIIKYALSKVDFYTAFKSDLQDLLKKLLHKLGVKNEIKFYIVNPTISFCPVKSSVTTSSCAFSIEQVSPIRILSISGFEKFKGTLDFLDTAKEFIRNSNNFEFIFVGVGNTAEELKKIIYKEKLADKVKVVNIVDRVELIKIMQQATLVLHTSYIETGPAVLIESLVCNKPIFIQDVGIAKKLSDFCEGIFIYRDFEELLEKLAQIAEDRRTISDIKIPDLFTNNTYFNASISKLRWIFS
jgi:glycosyltransferase involved in cell wall biosynthesis